MARAAARRGPTWFESLTMGWRHPLSTRLRGGLEAAIGLCMVLAVASYDPADPSLNASSALGPTNLLGRLGATLADICMQSLGLASWLMAIVLIVGGLSQAAGQASRPAHGEGHRGLSPLAVLVAVLALAGALAAPQPPAAWPLAKGLGGFWGDAALGAVQSVFDFAGLKDGRLIAAVILGVTALISVVLMTGLRRRDFAEAGAWLGSLRPAHNPQPFAPPARPKATTRARTKTNPDARLRLPEDDVEPAVAFDRAEPPEPAPAVLGGRQTKTASRREARENQGAFAFVSPNGFRLPELNMLTSPSPAPRRSTRPLCARTRGCWKACSPSSGSTARSIRSGPGRSSPFMNWCPPRG